MNSIIWARRNDVRDTGKSPIIAIRAR